MLPMMSSHHVSAFNAPPSFQGSSFSFRAMSVKIRAIHVANSLSMSGSSVIWLQVVHHQLDRYITRATSRSVTVTKTTVLPPPGACE